MPWGSSLGFAEFSGREGTIPDTFAVNEPANSLRYPNPQVASPFREKDVSLPKKRQASLLNAHS